MTRFVGYDKLRLVFLEKLNSYIRDQDTNMSSSKVVLINPQVDYARMFGKASTTTPIVVPHEEEQIRGICYGH